MQSFFPKKSRIYGLHIRKVKGKRSDLISRYPIQRIFIFKKGMIVSNMRMTLKELVVHLRDQRHLQSNQIAILGNIKGLTDIITIVISFYMQTHFLVLK